MAERDAVKRLHMLCDWVEKQMDESPYDSASWDELQDNNAYLQTMVAELKKEARENRDGKEGAINRLVSERNDMLFVIEQFDAFLTRREINDVPSEIIEGINRHLINF